MLNIINFRLPYAQIPTFFYIKYLKHFENFRKLFLLNTRWSNKDEQEKWNILRRKFVEWNMFTHQNLFWDKRKDEQVFLDETEFFDVGTCCVKFVNIPRNGLSLLKRRRKFYERNWIFWWVNFVCKICWHTKKWFQIKATRKNKTTKYCSTIDKVIFWFSYIQAALLWEISSDKY